jgi:hypothetical protein
VLDWATLDSDLRSSKHMVGNNSSSVLYTAVYQDKYYWLKSSTGDTWDINLYDSTYIYQWITETGYGTPRNYKRYSPDTKVPWMPRCAMPGLPGEHLEIPDTGFAIATSCQENSYANVGHGIVGVLTRRESLDWSPGERRSAATSPIARRSTSSPGIGVAIRST